LGGGSPNDLAPALNQWKESFGSTVALGLSDSDALRRIPVQIADLANELWQRANAAAAVELKGGSGAPARSPLGDDAFRGGRADAMNLLRSTLNGSSCWNRLPKHLNY
jgi:hypothetical protein